MPRAALGEAAGRVILGWGYVLAAIFSFIASTEASAEASGSTAVKVMRP
jgi:hypothetical protein